MDRNIAGSQLPATEPPVALRKESVDRNIAEMTEDQSEAVALRKESVDRNLIGSINRAIDISRSPQGERG